MNKFLILIAAFLLIIQFSNAQTTAGTQNLGFTLSYYSTKANLLFVNPGYNSTSYSTHANNFTIGPSYAYFVANNLDVGSILYYSSSNSGNSGDSAINPANESNKTWGVTAFIRKYFLYQNKIGFRTGLYLGYDRQAESMINSPSQSAYNQNATTNDYNAGVRFDIVYFPLKHMGVSATIANVGYDNYKSNNVTQGTTGGNSINANFTNGLQLSMVYIF